jgi:hypothetical protein
MATKNTIQGTMNWAAAFILNRPSSGVAGAYQEPGLTIANLIMSTILAPPFAWQWNRSIFNVATTVGQSDYTVSLPNFGWLEKATLSLSGMTPPVVELQISPLIAASGKNNRPFKIAMVDDDNAGNVTFRLMAIPDQVYTVTLIYQKAPVQATTLFGASLGSITSIAAAVAGSTVYTASGGFTGGAANGLVGQYLIISTATSSANNGIFFCTASSATTITLNNQNGVLQAGAAGTAQAGTTWAPIPDKYNFLYERGMLAHLHAIYDMATYAMELQLFFRQLVNCSEGLSDTAKAIFLEDRLDMLRTEAAAQAASTAAPKRAQ